MQTPQYDKSVSKMLIQQNQAHLDSPMCSREQGFRRLQQLQENQKLLKNGKSMVNQVRPGHDRVAPVIKASFINNTNPSTTKPLNGANYPMASGEIALQAG